MPALPAARRLLPALLAAGLAQPAASAEPSAAELGAQLDAAEARTHVEGDAAAVQRLWSDAFVVTNLFGTFLTRAEALERARSGAIRFTSLSRAVELARREGPFLFTAGIETAAGAPGSVIPEGKTVRIRYTHVWRLEAGRWRLWLRHAWMPVPDPAGGEARGSRSASRRPRRRTFHVERRGPLSGGPDRPRRRARGSRPRARGGRTGRATPRSRRGRGCPRP